MLSLYVAPIGASSFGVGKDRCSRHFYDKWRTPIDTTVTTL